jgi:hypothetical protein
MALLAPFIDVVAVGVVGSLGALLLLLDHSIASP